MSGRPYVLLMAIALVVTACGRLEPVEPELASILPEPTASVPTPVPTTDPVADPTAVPELPTPIEVPSPAAAAAASASAQAPTPEPTAEVAAPTATPTLAPAPAAGPTAAPTQPPAPTTAAPTAAPFVPTPIPTATDQLIAVANGAEVYSINCARCHSESGLGTFQASGLIGINANWSSASLAVELTDGHPVTFGFGHTLSPDEIDAVVAYVLATF